MAQDPPLGMTVVVYRRIEGQFRFLLLHRAAFELDFDGEWAWTPPAGGRQPGEQPNDCARRELKEEAGLALEPQRTGLGDQNWYIYQAEARPEEQVQLIDPEHNGYRWVSLAEAVALCKPAMVGEQTKAVARQLGIPLEQVF